MLLQSTQIDSLDLCFIWQTPSRHLCPLSKLQRWHPCWSQKKYSTTMSPRNKDLFEGENERGLFNKRFRRTSTSTTLIFNWTFAPPVQPFESNQLQSGGAWPILFTYHSFWANNKHHNNNNNDQITTWPRPKRRPCQKHNAWSEKKVIITDLRFLFQQSTRFSNSGFCHLGVNFFVFYRNLKTKTDLKFLCNF